MSSNDPDATARWLADLKREQSPPPVEAGDGEPLEYDKPEVQVIDVTRRRAPMSPAVRDAVRRTITGEINPTDDTDSVPLPPDPPRRFPAGSPELRSQTAWRAPDVSPLLDGDDVLEALSSTLQAPVQREQTVPAQVRAVTFRRPLGERMVRRFWRDDPLLDWSDGWRPPPHQRARWAWRWMRRGLTVATAAVTAVYAAAAGLWLWLWGAL